MENRKTKIVIEIESPYKYDLRDEETFKKLSEKEAVLVAETIHNQVRKCISNFITNDLEEVLFDRYIEEYYIDGWERLKDYGIKIEFNEQ